MVFETPRRETKQAPVDLGAMKRDTGGDGGVKEAKTFSISPLTRAVVDNNTVSIKSIGSTLSTKELTDMLFFASALKTTEKDTIVALVDAGANIHSRDSFGRTPLHEAAVFGNADIAVALVKAGVDMNAVSREGNTAMLEAAKFKHYDVVAALVDMHADTGVKNRWGRTAVPAVEMALLLRKSVA